MSLVIFIPNPSTLFGVHIESQLLGQHPNLFSSLKPHQKFPFTASSLDQTCLGKSKDEA